MWATSKHTTLGNNDRRGFTIVELLIVIVVIGILAAITIVSYNGIQQRAQAATVQSELSGASKKLEEYRTLHADTVYPYSNTMFIAAKTKFSEGSYRHIVYCYSATTPDTYALIASTKSKAKAFQYTPEGGLKPYMGDWSTVAGSTGICSQVNPNLTVGVWLYSSVAGWAGSWI